MRLCALCVKFREYFICNLYLFFNISRYNKLFIIPIKLVLHSLR